jgi:serine/threonine-protein kinase
VKKYIVYIILVVIFFIVGIIITNSIIMPSMVHMGEEVTVPNVCNLPLEDAIERLRHHKLEGIVIERRYDHIIDEGNVIIQSPLPGAKAKQGRIINLTVSLGPAFIKIPYLSGIDFEKGKLILKNLGLIIKEVDSTFSDSLPQGMIVSTIPGFESEVKKGDAITVVVSKGTVLKIPNVIGMTLNEAQRLVERMGLVMGEIKEVEASGTRGHIIIQHPEPDQLAKVGDTINVMVIE